MTAERDLTVGDRVIYRGGDEELLGEAGTIVHLGRGQCMVRLDMGDMLSCAAREISATTPPDTIARARRLMEDRASSQDALRGALRLLLAHISEQNEVPGDR